MTQANTSLTGQKYKSFSQLHKHGALKKQYKEQALPLIEDVDPEDHDYNKGTRKMQADRDKHENLKLRVQLQ